MAQGESNKENIIRKLSTFVREVYTCRRGSRRKDTAEREPDICGISVSCYKGGRIRGIRLGACGIDKRMTCRKSLE